MTSGRQAVRKLVGHATDAAVSAVGDVAGATVAPRTAWSMLRAKVTSPAVLVPAGIAVVAYAVGRRRARGA